MKIEFTGMPESRLQIPLEPLHPMEVIGEENVSIQMAQQESENVSFISGIEWNFLLNSIS